jgi:hypothetical protein
MITANQQIDIILTFNNTLTLTNNQLRYINDNIAELVKNSIIAGNCSSINLKSGFDIYNDEVIVKDFEYTFEFLASIKGEYSKNIINNNYVSNSMHWNHLEKIDEIDKSILRKEIKTKFLLADFGEHVDTINIIIHDITNIPPSSNW